MMWLRIYQHLLPNARAWRITIDKQLRRFFVALASVAEDVEGFFDRVHLDIFPSTTRFLTEYERQFYLDGNGTTAQRRDRIAAAWRRTGGQSPRYIQDQLRGAGFDVYVHEWFAGRQLEYAAEAGQAEAECGAIFAECGVVPSPAGQPVIRNPNVYLVNEGDIVYTVQTGETESQTGVASAVTGGRNDQRGYPLINRTGAGDALYSMSSDPSTFSAYWYVGGQFFPDKAQVPAGRRREFERLLLTLGPAHMWVGVLVEYT